MKQNGHLYLYSYKDLYLYLCCTLNKTDVFDYDDENRGCTDVVEHDKDAIVFAGLISMWRHLQALQIFCILELNVLPLAHKKGCVYCICCA